MKQSGFTITALLAGFAGLLFAAGPASANLCAPTCSVVDASASLGDFCTTDVDCGAGGVCNNFTSCVVDTECDGPGAGGGDGFCGLICTAGAINQGCESDEDCGAGGVCGNFTGDKDAGVGTKRNFTAWTGVSTGAGIIDLWPVTRGEDCIKANSLCGGVNGGAVASVACSAAGETADANKQLMLGAWGATCGSQGFQAAAVKPGNTLEFSSFNQPFWDLCAESNNPVIGGGPKRLVFFPPPPDLESIVVCGGITIAEAGKKKAIPTLSAFGLMAFGLLLTGAMYFALRRRDRAVSSA